MCVRRTVNDPGERAVIIEQDLDRLRVRQIDPTGIHPGGLLEVCADYDHAIWRTKEHLASQHARRTRNQDSRLLRTEPSSQLFIHGGVRNELRSILVIGPALGHQRCRGIEGLKRSGISPPTHHDIASHAAIGDVPVVHIRDL